jgi:hypothetical protein
LANETRRDPSADHLTDIRRKLRAERAEEYIQSLIDDAPALTDQQRVHLAGLLRPVDGGRHAT